MKKSIIFALFFLLCIVRLSAQSNTVALGGEATGSGGTASFTAGEVFNTFKTGASGSSTDGVQQSYSAVIQLLTGAVSTSMCAGSALSVPFTASGITAGNTFTAQLSDGTGSFAAPVVIGTLVGSISGDISCVIPANTPAGNAYRIRVVSSTPLLLGEDNGSAITINAVPVLSCPANISVSNTTGQCGANVSFAATATGNPTITYSIASGSFFPIGTTTVTVTATNSCGAPTCTFTVTVTDNQAPVITCPANITNVIATSANGAVVTYSTPVGTDNCSGAVTTRTAGLASGATFPIGTTTVTKWVTDAAGLTASCSFTVTVVGVAPAIACPANISVNNTTGQCGAAVTFAATETVGNPASVITYSIASGSNFPVGTTTVTATATNAVGSSSCTFTVTVNDTQVPSLAVVPSVPHIYDALGRQSTFSNINLGGTGTNVANVAPNASVSLTFNRSTIKTGACSSCITQHYIGIAGQWASQCLFSTSGASSAAHSFSFTAPSTPGVYYITRTASWQFNCITMSMPTNPKQALAVLIVGNGSSCPDNVVVNADPGQCGAVVSNLNPSIIDNCPGGTVVQTAGLPSGSLYPVGTTTNTFVATDLAGNTATCSYSITVNDTTKPVITCPANISATSNIGCGTAIAVGTATATDNCGVDHVSGVRSDGLALTDLYPIGVTTISWTASDIHENVSLPCIQTITVTGQQVVATPANQTICSGSPIVKIVLSGSVAGTSYDWTRDNTGSVTGIASSGSGDISGLLTNTTSAPVTVTFTITPNLNGCSGTLVTATVTVDATTVGGTVSGGSSPICTGFAAGTLTLSANVGAVLQWESSTDGVTWYPIANTTTTQVTGTLTETTTFRAAVQSGSCLIAYSDPLTITVYQQYPFYADNDGDAYGAGPAVSLCSVNATTVPSGYSLDNTDCDDNKGDRHQTFPFYVDADGDTYGAVGSTAVQLCAVNGSTPPVANYVVNNTDCNDAVFAINPGVVDTPYDSIDNNCDGSLFDGHAPVVVAVLSPSCGGINHGINNTINCTEIYLGPGYVIGYRFKVTNLITGQVAYVDTVQHHFKLSDTNIYSYGTPYSIQVAAIVNGEVQPYNGSTCSFTTTTVATTKVIATQCGSTLLFMNSNINATAVNQAIAYRFRVARADAPGVYYLSPERTAPNFNLTLLTVPDGFLTYATEYKVDVQIKIKSANFIAWSQFGQVCSIFTPAMPETALIVSQCELTATSNTQLINTTPFANVTLYRFRLTLFDLVGDLVYSQSVDTPNPSFTLSMFTGLLPVTTYNVSVSMKLYGSYVDYGKDCTVTTPGVAKMMITTSFKAVAYPNPFAKNFMIDVTSASQDMVKLKVYDLIGRLIEQREVKVSDLETSTIGDSYPSGVYNIVVTQGDEVRTLRVVKR